MDFNLWKDEDKITPILLQVISLGFMHHSVLIKSVIQTSFSFNLQQCKTSFIHNLG